MNNEVFFYIAVQKTLKGRKGEREFLCKRVQSQTCLSYAERSQKS